MSRAPNDDRIETTSGKIAFFSAMIEKMEGDLDDAEGRRKEALIKLIQIGQERLAHLKSLN